MAPLPGKWGTGAGSFGPIAATPPIRCAILGCELSPIVLCPGPSGVLVCNVAAGETFADRDPGGSSEIGPPRGGVSLVGR